MSKKSLEASCPVCDSRGRFLCETCCAHDSSIVIQHYRCRDCKLVFVGNRFDNEQLRAAYSACDTQTYYAEVRSTEAQKFQTAIDNLRQLGTTSNSQILDIGTGNGDFLAFLQDAGFSRLAAHEIPGANTDQLDRRGIPVYRDYDFASLPMASFDVVMMMDVMEHVPDPHAAAAAVFRALKPGGVWYFHTPFVTPLDRMMHAVQKLPGLRRVGEAWQRSRTSIYHLRNYTRAAVERILRAQGFELALIRVRNELSWPLSRYVRHYCCRRLGLPDFTAKLLAPLAAPLIATNLVNPNKGIVAARKPIPVVSDRVAA